MRTKFFDDFVTAAAATIASARTDGGATAGRRAQVVLLGAGYDTRSWRSRAASEEARARTSVYEVDVEEVLARKREVVGDAPLTLGAERREVASDIAEDDWVAALRAAGMSTELPTVWVLEGLLYYLSPRCAKKTLALCHRSCGPGSVARRLRRQRALAPTRAARAARSASFCAFSVAPRRRPRASAGNRPATSRPRRTLRRGVSTRAPNSATARSTTDVGPARRRRRSPPTRKSYRRDPTPRTFYVAASK